MKKQPRGRTVTLLSSTFYLNLLLIIALMPGAPKAKVKSRIILTPEHTKRLHKALGDNIKRFEQANGKINVQEQPQIPLNFGPTGEA